MDQAETPLKPKILLSPLDWGLGHATRCIPVVKELIRQNTEVLLACEGNIRILLEKEFPQLKFVDLKGYNVSYSKNKWTLPFTILSQIPKIVSAIEEENQKIDEIVKDHDIHGIISDNRYGLYHDEIPSVFITHQLLVKSSLGNTIDEQLQKLNYSFINKFSECWIPDYEGNENLGGDLSHPAKMPGIKTSYVGPLSRFSSGNSTNEKHILILLSGPEPQRTILEEMLSEQVKEQKDAVVFVRGLPGQSKPLDLPSNVTVYDHLPADELNEVMLEAGMVISRTGYSTIMDLAALKKKSILIPTPGQPEQEYLARHLMQRNFALCIDQQKFKLKNALALSSSFNYMLDYPSYSNLGLVIKEFLVKLDEG